MLKYLDLEKTYRLTLAFYIILFTIPKGNALEWLCIGTIIYLSIYKLFFLKYNIFNKQIVKDKVFLLLLVLVFFQFFTNFFSYDIWDGLREFRKTSLPILVVGFSILLFYKTITFEYIYKVFSLSLIVITLYYFYESYQYMNTLNIFVKNFSTPRDATFIIPIVFPFVIFGLYAFPKDKLFSILSISGIVLSLLIILYSGSRGALLAFSTEVLAFILFTIKSKKKTYLIFPVVFLGLFYASTYIESINKKFHSAIDKGVSPNGRDSILLSLQKPIVDNLLLGQGKGLNNNANTVEEYNLRRYLVKNNGKSILITHNMFINILRESGVFALLAYLLIIILVSFRLFHFKKNFESKYNKISFAIIVAFLDHFVLRAMVEDLNIARFYLLVFIFLAIYYNEIKRNENSIHIS